MTSMKRADRSGAKKVAFWLPKEIYEWMNEEAEDNYTTLTGVAVRVFRAAMDEYTLRSREQRTRQANAQAPNR